MCHGSDTIYFFSLATTFSGMSANFSFFINTWGPLLRPFQQRRGRTRARSSLPRWQGSPVFTCFFFKKINTLSWLEKYVTSKKISSPCSQLASKSRILGKKSNILRETVKFTAFVFFPAPVSVSVDVHLAVGSLRRVRVDGVDEGNAGCLKALESKRSRHKLCFFLLLYAGNPGIQRVYTLTSCTKKGCFLQNLMEYRWSIFIFCGITIINGRTCSEKNQVAIPYFASKFPSHVVCRDVLPLPLLVELRELLPPHLVLRVGLLRLRGEADGQGGAVGAEAAADEQVVVWSIKAKEFAFGDLKK